MSEALERAIATTTSVLAKVDRGQLSAPTPCASWDVKALVNHVVGGMHFFKGALAGEAQGGESPADFAEGDFAAAYADNAKQVLAGFDEPGVGERVFTLPFGTMPGTALKGLVVLDTFQHAWDLAKATGQSTDLDPELASQLISQAKVSIPDQVRGPDDAGAPFGFVVEVADDACAADRLAGLLGRQV